MKRRLFDSPKYCVFCLQECETETVDEGIGSYEYWGAPGVDVKLVEVSACCGEDVTDELEETDDDDN
jgi:hypothetical protein